MNYSKAISVGSCGVALFLCATTARSAPKKPNVCTPAFSAYKSAHAAVQAGHLREARDELLTCAESKCGGLAPKCKAAYDKLGSAMPSIIPIVTDETGAPRADVEVKIDGEPLASQLDGRALPVEPGVHELSFSMDGSVFDTQKLMIIESDHDHVVNVARHTPGALKTAVAVATRAPPPKALADSSSSAGSSTERASSDEPSSDKSSGEAQPVVSTQATMGQGQWALPRSPWPYVLGGAGLAAVAAGGLLTYWGNKDNTQLQNQCAPNCTTTDADHVKAMYVASDISFGVGLAALGVTTWLFASSHSAEKAPAPSAAVLSVSPTPSGAFASVSGAF